MQSIEKTSSTKFHISLSVKTNAKNQKIVINEDKLTVSLKSRPVQNKANIELLKLIKKKLNISTNQIKLISGLRGNNKTIEITFKENFDKKHIIKMLLV